MLQKYFIILKYKSFRQNLHSAARESHKIFVTLFKFQKELHVMNEFRTLQYKYNIILINGMLYNSYIVECEIITLSL